MLIQLVTAQVKAFEVWSKIPHRLQSGGNEGALPFVLFLVVNVIAPSQLSPSSNLEAKMQIALELGWCFSCWIMTNARGWLMLKDFVHSAHIPIASQILLPQFPNLNCHLYLKCVPRNIAEYTCITAHLRRKSYLARVLQQLLMNHCCVLMFLAFPCHWNDKWTGKHLVIKRSSSMIKSPIFVWGPSSLVFSWGPHRSLARKEALAGKDSAYSESHFERNRSISVVSGMIVIA